MIKKNDRITVGIGNREPSLYKRKQKNGGQEPAVKAGAERKKRGAKALVPEKSAGRLKKGKPVFLRKRQKKKQVRRGALSLKERILAMSLAGGLILTSALILINVIFSGPPHAAVDPAGTAQMLPEDTGRIDGPPEREIREEAQGLPRERAGELGALLPAERPVPQDMPPEIPAPGLPGFVAAIPPEIPVEPVPRGKLVFVIDDAGNNLGELEPFLRFPGPLTIAVLPGLAYSAEAARRIRAAGKEVFLHQPMEAIGGQDPGPGAVYIGMDTEEVREIITRNITEIGPVAGMNNHQGSRVTMDGGIMETVLILCREMGIYFLDSRTTADTAAPSLARQMGLRIGERDTFIDNDQERASMIRYINEGLNRAKRRGSSVMIGHTWSRELAGILAELYPSFIEQGYTLSTVSAFIAGE
ncbi:MAG: divergent polysaccharide deacetylase family protein [Treponema sp.]|jgi:polysaccharide deacetylase 2 family uncharacterized protein YibQ|nr:divergent polysaccharide deacetylase family protein [Treponema sp.]